MGTLDHKQGQLVKELVDEIVCTLMVEYNLVLDESARIQAILAEAAETLRTNFKSMDAMIRENADVDFVAKYGSDYEDSYRKAVATLQFEDIVTQILGHHMERAMVTQSILGRITDALSETFEEPAEQDARSVLLGLRNDINSCLSSITLKDSVMQQSLEVGETELF